MENTHTGDNWRVAAQAGGNETADFSVIADVVPIGGIDEIRVIADVFDSLPNARLIAAAPDMAEALEGCKNMLKEAAEILQSTDNSYFAERAFPLYSAARAALKKAGV